ncbi:hypothetical protein [Confluentibacter sediminis]|uniref:hypothetical protein n=1 Tax=Confluentibacter sediminis TaxID=2219045 RepID=UPI001C731D52|nr:hypothetical protein [Confluentibacter sediminis]
MTFLTPEIEALSKNMITKSLIRPTISCGIFQDLDIDDEKTTLYCQQKLENNKGLI